jgi:NodT family efflux transporter outer membrane factor (OMF) lipoprotein
MCMWAPDSGRATPGRRAARGVGLVGLLAATLAGCAVGPDFTRPAAPGVTHYAHDADPAGTPAAQGVAQRFMPGAKVAPQWWRLFNSDKLDAVVVEALAANPGLKAAQASLRQSEHTLRSGYGIFYPSVAADAAGKRERLSLQEFGQPNAPSPLFNLFTLSASVSYVLDLFGGERRMIEGLHAQVDLERANEQATYIMLIANIINTVVAQAAYRAEVQATDELIALQREQVRLAEVQVNSGTAAYSTVLSLRSQLAATEATIPQLEQKLAQSADLLATLAGHLPADWNPPQVALADLTLPGELPVSLPSELVRQRPDILAAEATAHAASANVGVATAAMLPAITLSGAYSANSTTTGNLLAGSGRAWSFGGDLTQPLFEGGTLWYRRKAAIDNYQEAMALYRQAVLAAFAQVADTLQALEHDAAALRAQDEALATSREALRLVQINYEAGLNTFLDVLVADSQYHQALVNDLEATALRYQDTVALYAALGGGWWSAEGAAAPAGQAPGP